MKRFESDLLPLAIHGEGAGGEVWGIELTHPKESTNPIISRQRIDPAKLELAKRFRKEPTEQEAQVWGWLRNRRMKGLKFRRQQVIEGFITDFYCAEYHLAIELDGKIHETEEAKSYDQAREEIFAAKGIRLIRVPNEECTIDGLEDRIVKYLTSPPQPPLPPGGSAVTDHEWRGGADAI